MSLPLARQTTQRCDDCGYYVFIGHAVEPLAVCSKCAWSICPTCQLTKDCVEEGMHKFESVPA